MLYIFIFNIICVFQVHNWDGPVVAIVYGTVLEISTLLPNITLSTIKNNDVIYHVVYKNEVSKRYLLLSSLLFN